METIYNRINDLTKCVLNFFRPINDYSDALEKFLESKSVSSVSEIEFWMREYELHTSRKFIQLTE